MRMKCMTIGTNSVRWGVNSPASLARASRIFIEKPEGSHLIYSTIVGVVIVGTKPD